MKVFQMRELKEAVEYAKQGGQALHVWNPSVLGPPEEIFPHAPKVFLRNKSQWAHLFDQDLGRLKKICRKLGVNKMKPERVGTDKQHIDLCGKPLERAIKMAEEETDA
jgi:hypothetical protein